MLIVEFNPLGLLVEVGCFFIEDWFLRFSSLCGIHIKVKIVSVGDPNS